MVIIIFKENFMLLAKNQEYQNLNLIDYFLIIYLIKE